MSNTITIQSINYSGEVANILFKPNGVNVVINLGNQVLPYVFNPTLLTPPRTVYGVYTILVDGADCSVILNVPLPTPTMTPTPTVTPSVTPTAIPTIALATALAALSIDWSNVSPLVSVADVILDDVTLPIA